jgi:hypothetical protein
MSQTSDQRPISEAERILFRLYVNCALSATHPRQLYQEIGFTYEQLALIAGCSLPTMTRWMNRDGEPRTLKDIYLRRLGEFYFLLHHYHQIPPEVWDLICPLSPRMRDILYPPSELAE